MPSWSKYLLSWPLVLWGFCHQTYSLYESGGSQWLVTETTLKPLNKGRWPPRASESPGACSRISQALWAAVLQRLLPLASLSGSWVRGFRKESQQGWPPQPGTLRKAGGSLTVVLIWLIRDTSSAQAHHLVLLLARSRFCDPILTNATAMTNGAEGFSMG